MRKLPLFGFTDEPVDYEFPKPDDLRRMCPNKPIRVTGFMYKPGTVYASRFGALRVLYSGDNQSPVLCAVNQNESNLQTCLVDCSKVKRIQGSIKGLSYVHRVLFFDEKNVNVATLKVGDDKGLAPEQMIEPMEEIIGVYGTKDKNTCIYSLGFIVWTPE